MRPDQQQSPVVFMFDRVESVLDSANIGSPSSEEIWAARDAVAEYIAANDEYDAAKVALERATENGGDGLINMATWAMDRADIRRSTAHARMKGETK